jgi:hypothetical protein
MINIKLKGGRTALPKFTTSFTPLINELFGDLANFLEAQIKNEWTEKSGWVNPTGTSYYRWSVEYGSNRLQILNSTAYAQYVHRAGRKGTTVLETEINPLIEKLLPELTENLIDEIYKNLFKG